MEETRGVREGRRPRYKEDGGDARSERGENALGTRKMEETRGVERGDAQVQEMEEARGVREGDALGTREDGGGARSERGETP